MKIQTRKTVFFEEHEIIEITNLIGNAIGKEVQFNFGGRAAGKVEIPIPQYWLEALASYDLLGHTSFEKDDLPYRGINLVGQEVLSISLEIFDLEGDCLLLSPYMLSEFEIKISEYLTFGKREHEKDI